MMTFHPIDAHRGVGDFSPNRCTQGGGREDGGYHISMQYVKHKKGTPRFSDNPKFHPLKII
jgi:hypothetical protein